MSIFEQRAILSSIHPFDSLTQRIISDLSAEMDIAYYPKDTLLLSPSLESEYLYIIIKGHVHEILDDEIHNVYGELDSFDANALIYDDLKSSFVVQEDLICYLLKKETFLNLIQDHNSFANYYMQDFISKHQALKEHQQQNDLTPFMMSKVSDIFLHTPCIVSENTSINSALLEMQTLKSTAILIKKNNELGIVTDVDLREKVLMKNLSLETSIHEIANFPLIEIGLNDFLFNALLMFTKHNIKRIAVRENGKIIGVLEQLDLLSHFANHSHLIVIKVIKAQSIEELHSIAQDQLFLVRSLYSKGVKVRYISKLVSELNLKIHEKVFELSVPSALREKSTLVLLGSEGREEQILRTDQDNALIIADGIEEEQFTPYMEKFSQNLEALGFPPCKGHVMVNNALWRGDVSRYKKRIDDWIENYTEETLQQLSIFLDAKSATGDEKLLKELKEYIHKSFVARDDILAHLAKAALSFETPLSMFSTLVVQKKEHVNEIDLKKGGLFALVHGIRILSLEKGLSETNTSLRIKELNNMGLFNKSFATELIEAYDTLSATRLQSMLNHPESLEDGNYINPSKLDKIERDLLKDSFKVVNTFKKFLTYHYHLNMVL